LPTTSTGIQIARNLQSTCFLQNYNFNWHSNCLQFTINLLFARLQLQLAFKLPETCNPLLFAYNFNWHINYLQLAIHCSLPTTTPGIHIARKFAIRLLFAYNYHFAPRFSDLRLLRPQCL